MKKSMIILSLTALAAGFAFAGSADAGYAKSTKKKQVVVQKQVTKRDFGRRTVVHKDVTKVVNVKKVTKVYEPRHGSWGHDHGSRYYGAFPAPFAPFGSVAAVGSFGGFSFSIGAPVVFPAPMPCTYVVEQVWIEPVTETRLVGYDVFMNPIYENVIVAPGSYQNAQYRLHMDGSREFVTYLP
ncbi:MAG: hypothetical protein V2A76_12755 [Planctomycetota bacterium]